VFGPGWHQLASQKELWCKWWCNFKNIMVARFRLSKLLPEPKELKQAAVPVSRERLCVTAPKLIFQSSPMKCMRLLIAGDSKLVCQWANADWKASNSVYKDIISRVWNILGQRLFLPVPLLPCCDHGNFHQHIYRELNGQADAEANLARSSSYLDIRHWILRWRGSTAAH